jgi:hypothetical protein
MRGFGRAKGGNVANSGTVSGCRRQPPSLGCPNLGRETPLYASPIPGNAELFRGA